jgi:UDP-N-acetylglucosamine 2-epimerase (non-hydrolysing)
MPLCVLVVVGTRPEAVKMAPLVQALRAAPWAKTRLLVTAQHAELVAPILQFFGQEPDCSFVAPEHGQDLQLLTERLLDQFAPLLAQERPDLVLGQGDTTSVLAAALASRRHGVPFGHVEAGLRSHDLQQPFPEEANRVAIAKIAALHFAPTAAARDNLLREGVDKAAVHVTGNTGIDALLWAKERAPIGAFLPAAGRRLVLMTAHRREHHGARLAAVCEGLRRLAQRADVEALVPVHPNPAVRAIVEAQLHGCANVRLCPPLGYPEMVAAMGAATLILTDSGGLQEEAPSLGKPVLVLRSVTERPEGVAAGAARLVGTDPDAIVAHAQRLLDDEAAYRQMAQVRHLYGDGAASGRILAALAGWRRA